MSEHLGLAVLGARDSILGFRALGLDVFPVTSPSQARTAFDECVRRGYAAIFVTEGFVSDLDDKIRALAGETTPATVVIPEGQESRGLGLAKLRAVVVRAIGADILFRGEGKQ